MIEAVRIAGRQTFARFKIALIIALVAWLYAGLPPSLWLKVDHIKLADTYEFTDTTMDVKRELVRPFFGEWQVELEREAFNGKFVFVDKAIGSNDYNHDQGLPDPLLFTWWTWEKGKEPLTKRLSAGNYRIETCWWVVLPIIYDRRLCVTSDTFTVQKSES